MKINFASLKTLCSALCLVGIQFFIQGESYARIDCSIHTNVKIGGSVRSNVATITLANDAPVPSALPCAADYTFVSTLEPGMADIYNTNDWTVSPTDDCQIKSMEKTGESTTISFYINDARSAGCTLTANYEYKPIAFSSKATPNDPASLTAPTIEYFEPPAMTKSTTQCTDTTASKSRDCTINATGKIILTAMEVPTTGWKLGAWSIDQTNNCTTQTTPSCDHNSRTCEISTIMKNCTVTAQYIPDRNVLLTPAIDLPQMPPPAGVALPNVPEFQYTNPTVGGPYTPNPPACEIDNSSNTKCLHGNPSSIPSTGNAKFFKPPLSAVYTFDGWNSVTSASNCGETANVAANCNSGDKATCTITNIVADCKISAKYSYTTFIPTRAVTLDGRTDTADTYKPNPDKPSVNTTETVTFTQANSIPLNSEFTNWTLSGSCGQVEGQTCGAYPTCALKGLAGVCTVTANYTIPSITPTSAVSKPGTGAIGNPTISPASIKAGESATFTAVTAPNNYTFDGWSVDQINNNCGASSSGTCKQAGFKETSCQVTNITSACQVTAKYTFSASISANAVDTNTPSNTFAEFVPTISYTDNGQTSTCANALQGCAFASPPITATFTKISGAPANYEFKSWDYTGCSGATPRETGCASGDTCQLGNIMLPCRVIAKYDYKYYPVSVQFTPSDAVMSSEIKCSDTSPGSNWHSCANNKVRSGGAVQFKWTQETPEVGYKESYVFDRAGILPPPSSSCGNALLDSANKTYTINNVNADCNADIRYTCPEGYTQDLTFIFISNYTGAAAQGNPEFTYNSQIFTVNAPPEFTCNTGKCTTATLPKDSKPYIFTLKRNTGQNNKDTSVSFKVSAGNCGYNLMNNKPIRIENNQFVSETFAGINSKCYSFTGPNTFILNASADGG